MSITRSPFRPSAAGQFAFGNDAQSETYIDQQMGITRDHLRAKSIIKAVNNPTQYLNDRLAFLDAVKVELAEIYRKNMIALTNKGYSQAKAEELVAEQLSALYSVKMSQYEAENGVPESFLLSSARQKAVTNEDMKNVFLEAIKSAK